MQRYDKSRFDEKMPFDVLRAEDFGEDLYEFYEPLENLIRRVSGVNITGSRPVFLIGGRGTGKTMVLKFLSLRMQLKDFIKNNLKQNKQIEKLNKKEVCEFISGRKFFGIYLHFRTTEYGAIKGELDKFFLPYLSMKVLEEIMSFLIIIKSSGLISYKQESRISQYICDQIKEPRLKIKNNFNDIIKLIKIILSQFELIFNKSSYSTLDEIKSKYSIPVLISKNIIFGVSDFIFNELPCLENKNLFIFLDEMEFLSNYQIQCICSLIKDSDETSVIFKVGSRYMPKVLPVGESGEVLQETHDFREVNISDALNAAHGGRKNEYSSLIMKILNKRLEKSRYFRGKKIVNLFPNISLEKEARDLVKGREKHWDKFKVFLKKEMAKKRKMSVNHIIECLKYPQNPIVEKLNMLLYYRGKDPMEIRKMFQEYLKNGNEQYNFVYKKNALNLLFQLYSDYRTEKKYFGIDVFIHLSSGIIRHAIELCNNALQTAYNYGYENHIGEPINYEFQDSGAKSYSSTQFEKIGQIPNNQGEKAKNFINQLGGIFRALHLNKDLIEPEPTHFETIYADLSSSSKDVFDSVVNYSYLQKKPSMETKSIYDSKKDDYLINRILAPHFEISYRVRGRTYISPLQVQSLIEGGDKEKKLVLKEVIKQNAKKESSNENQKEFESF